MPTASARGVMRYIDLKGRRKAREFQKIKTLEWLNENLRNIRISNNR